jgi:hypothetical protein
MGQGQPRMRGFPDCQSVSEAPSIPVTVAEEKARKYPKRNAAFTGVALGERNRGQGCDARNASRASGAEAATTWRREWLKVPCGLS